MTDTDQTVIFTLNDDDRAAGRFGPHGDGAAAEDRPADVGGGLVSLGFIRAAARRSALFLMVMAVLGLVAGVGTYLGLPHKYQATASVLLTLSPYENTQTVPEDNQAIAGTRAVAGLALRRLGLHQTVTKFQSTYTATSVTPRVLTVTASAPSASSAVQNVNAVASAFLSFRAGEIQDEQNLVLASLSQQQSQARQRLASTGSQLAQAQSARQQSQVSKLQTEQTSEQNTLNGIQQAISSEQTTTGPAVAAALKGSQVISVAALPHSRLKSMVLDAVIGLVVALALGLGVVIVRALISTRLRWRADIAAVLGAPVKLSVGPLRARRWRRARARQRDLDTKRVVAHLRRAVPRAAQGPAGLAVVAVDNAPLVAGAVAASAEACASQGLKVVAVDLSDGAYLARMLGTKEPGIHELSRAQAGFTLVVPGRDDVAPAGPLRAGGPAAGPAGDQDLLGSSVAAADVLLSLVTLDPALGGDHLATWATHAVAVVSAGHSSAERLHGIAEMVRLGGTRLDSVVLAGADKSDESVGLAP